MIQRKLRRINNYQVSRSITPHSLFSYFYFMNQLLKPYHDLEIDAHVSLDDVLSKTTQEMGELLTAMKENNEPEIEKESADLLINILSMLGHLKISVTNDTNLETSSKSTEGISNELPLVLAEWHREVAAVR